MIKVMRRGNGKVKSRMRGQTGLTMFVAPVRIAGENLDGIPKDPLGEGLGWPLLMAFKPAGFGMTWATF